MKKAKAATSLPDDKAGPLAKNVDANCHISKSTRTCN
jgi:hypothetical protein